MGGRQIKGKKGKMTYEEEEEDTTFGSSKLKKPSLQPAPQKQELSIEVLEKKKKQQLKN